MSRCRQSTGPARTKVRSADSAATGTEGLRFQLAEAVEDLSELELPIEHREAEGVDDVTRGLARETFVSETLLL